MKAFLAKQREAFQKLLLADTLVLTKKTSRAEEAEDNFDLSPIIENERSSAPVPPSVKREIASNADSGNRVSIAIANRLAHRLGTPKTVLHKPAGQTLGDQFEKAVNHFVKECFPRMAHLRPGKWRVEQVTGRNALALAAFQQYEHLNQLAELTSQHALLKTVLGNEYLIAPDIVVVREPESDTKINSDIILVDEAVSKHASLRKTANPEAILHASISCKWTIRSDRSQNARSEALNLIRNRKGRAPHIIAVTAEPLPSRIASIALGTGDIDCVYHFALPELIEVVASLGFGDAADTLDMLVSGKRLRDISDLPLDLAV